MNIGIDARLLERKITGIGRSLLLLLKEIPKHDKQNQYFLFTYNEIDFEKSFYTNIKTFRGFLPQKLFSPIWSNLILPYYLKKNKIDILFSINQVIPLVKIKNCKYISVVHDVIYKADPSFLPFIYRKYLQLFAYFSIKKSDLIITVSEYSKKDILKNYKVELKKLRVILQSANTEFYPLELTSEEEQELRKKYNLKKNIVLYVGMIENRKNIYCVMKVADEISRIKKDVDFLLIGKLGYGGKKIIKQIRTRNNIIYIGSVTDAELRKIYNLASVFLFPSFYEGFGFPPLEAMQSGLPVVCSNSTSLFEIVGEGGLLHHPDDYISFTNDIVKLIDDKNFFIEMSKKGIEQSKKFKLSNTVNSIISVFNNLN